MFFSLLDFKLLGGRDNALLIFVLPAPNSVLDTK